MHNLVWKYLKLIPLIQLGGLGERYKVPKRVGRPAAKRYLVHFEFLSWEKLLVGVILCAYSRKKYPKIGQVNHLTIVSRDESTEGWLWLN